MANKLDLERFSRLPSWARDHIRDLMREREAAVNALNNFLNDQTQSEISWVEIVSTGEKQGPSFKKKYIQARKIDFNHAGIELAVRIHDEDAIQLQWHSVDHTSDIALIPKSFNMVYLVSKEKMR